MNFWNFKIIESIIAVVAIIVILWLYFDSAVYRLEMENTKLKEEKLLLKEKLEVYNDKNLCDKRY